MRHHLPTTITTLFFTTAALAGPLPQYTLTDLGTLLGGTNSYAFAINNNGVIAGGSNTSPNGFQHPVIFSGGTVHDLGLPPNTNAAIALSINNHNQVVGGNFPHFTPNRLQIDPNSTYLGGFHWTPPNIIAEPGSIPPEVAAQLRRDPFALGGTGTLSPAHPSYTSLHGISDTGLVAGTMLLENGQLRAAAGDFPASLGALASGNQSRVTGVSPSGLVTGWSNTPGRTRGFLGSMTEFSPDPALPDNSGNSALNAATYPTPRPNLANGGWIITHPLAAGWADSVHGLHRAAVWSSDTPGSPSFFAELPDASASEANAINAHSLAVGYSAIGGVDLRATAFAKGQSYDLNSLISLSSSPFYRLSMATGVNDHGQIVGYGLTKNNQVHAFLLNPVFSTLSAGDPAGQSTPHLPTGTTHAGRSHAFASLSSASWITAPFTNVGDADTLHYALTTPDAHITTITLPDSATNLTILVDGEVIATDLAPLTQITFTFDVTHFDLIGFDASLSSSLPLKLTFDTPSADLTLTPLSALPEPCALAALLPLTLLTRRRRT